MNSTTLTTSSKAQVGQYNILRSDILDEDIGHNHDGTNGVKVKYENLDWSDLEAPEGLNNSLKKLDDHVNQTGIHGLPANYSLVGMYKSFKTSGFYIQCGRYDHDLFAAQYFSGTITFDKQFEQVPVVLVMSIGHSGNPPPGAGGKVGIISISTRSFDFAMQMFGTQGAGGQLIGFYWIAIGY